MNFQSVFVSWHFIALSLLDMMRQGEAIEHSLEGQRYHRPQSYPYPYSHFLIWCVMVRGLRVMRASEASADLVRWLREESCLLRSCSIVRCGIFDPLASLDKPFSTIHADGLYFSYYLISSCLKCFEGLTWHKLGLEQLQAGQGKERRPEEESGVLIIF